jgi:mRNA interferase MazF
LTSATDQHARGNLVTVALQGDLGKPRPALVVQSDLFGSHPSVTVLPVTSALRDAPLLRITVQPDATNGLRAVSQVMVDKPQSVPRSRLGPSFGRASDETLLAVNRAMAVFLGLA